MKRIVLCTLLALLLMLGVCSVALAEDSTTLSAPLPKKTTAPADPSLTDVLSGFIGRLDAFLSHADPLTLNIEDHRYGGHLRLEPAANGLILALDGVQLFTDGGSLHYLPPAEATGSLQEQLYALLQNACSVSLRPADGALTLQFRLNTAALQAFLETPQAARVTALVPFLRQLAQTEDSTLTVTVTEDRQGVRLSFSLNSMVAPNHAAQTLTYAHGWLFLPQDGTPLSFSLDVMQDNTIPLHVEGRDGIITGAWAFGSSAGGIDGSYHFTQQTGEVLLNANGSYGTVRVRWNHQAPEDDCFTFGLAVSADGMLCTLTGDFSGDTLSLQGHQSKEHRTNSWGLTLTQHRHGLILVGQLNDRSASLTLGQDMRGHIASIDLRLAEPASLWIAQGVNLNTGSPEIMILDQSASGNGCRLSVTTTEPGLYTAEYRVGPVQPDLTIEGDPQEAFTLDLRSGVSLDYVGTQGTARFAILPEKQNPLFSFRQPGGNLIFSYRDLGGDELRFDLKERIFQIPGETLTWTTEPNALILTDGEEQLIFRFDGQFLTATVDEEVQTLAEITPTALTLTPYGADDIALRLALDADGLHYTYLMGKDDPAVRVDLTGSSVPAYIPGGAYASPLVLSEAFCDLVDFLGGLLN